MGWQEVNSWQEACVYITLKAGEPLSWLPLFLLTCNSHTSIELISPEYLFLS